MRSSNQNKTSKRPFEAPKRPANARIGKAQARRDFLPLVSSLSQNRQVVEITEHGKPVAVLLDYQTYQDLLRKTAPAASIESLKGSVTILDAIEQARREINEEFQRSVERRSRLL